MPTKKTKKKIRKPKAKPKQGFLKSKKTLFIIVLVLVLAGLILISKKTGFDQTNLKEGVTRIAAYVDELTVPLRLTTWKATLYFADESSDLLIKEFRSLSSVKSPEKMSEALIEELIKGPDAKGIRTLPEQTRLLSVDLLNDGLIVVDFSKEFTEFDPGGSSTEIITVYSIVNSLITNIKAVSRVRIIQEGETLDTIAGHIDCNKIFYADLKRVR